jgi:uncharacterized membrane protein YfcA
VVRLALHAGDGPALSLLQVIFLIAAGVLAGVVGTAGGITSLISYPALLAVGLPPFAANATNLVALTACWPGSAHGSQPELRGRAPWLRRWLPLSAAGGGAGAVLLLITPPGAFARVVPFLIVSGALTLIAEPWLRALRPARALRSGRGRGLTMAAALVFLSMYGGYFGAGSGVMTLALLLLVVDRDLPVANALKNMLNGATTLPAGILIACFGPVHWGQAAALAAGALVGSRIGPAVTRALPRVVTRWAVALLGLGLALWLWVKPSA